MCVKCDAMLLHNGELGAPSHAARTALLTLKALTFHRGQTVTQMCAASPAARTAALRGTE